MVIQLKLLCLFLWLTLVAPLSTAITNHMFLTCSAPALFSSSATTSSFSFSSPSSSPPSLTLPLLEHRFPADVGVWNQSPNPVQVQLCLSSSCETGSSKFSCVPVLPPNFNGTLVSTGTMKNLTFGAVRLVFCSAHDTVCFNSGDVTRYEDIVTPSTRRDDDTSFAVPASTNPSWPSLHVEIPHVKDNAALCRTEIDCLANVTRPICNRDSEEPRCVTVQQYLGQCASPCLLKSTGYRCWCQSLNTKVQYMIAAVCLCLVTYLLLYARIKRARSLALKKNSWGMRNSLLPLYKTCFQLFGVYLVCTVALRVLLSLDSSSSGSSESSKWWEVEDHRDAAGGGGGKTHHWYEEGRWSNVALRSVVAFMEETMLESVVFFFLQYGSGLDQGYRAVAGGVACGCLYATLTALQHIPIHDVLSDLTPTGTCIGCLLDREGVGYRRPYSSYCWVQLFRSGVYQGSSVVLYLFVLCHRKYESIIVSNGGWFRCCCHCLLRDSPSSGRRSRSVSYLEQPLIYSNTSVNSVNGGGDVRSVQSRESRGSFHQQHHAQHPRQRSTSFMRRNAHFDRFLMLLIVLRGLDMSYMLSGIGACTVIIGSFMWLVWLQVELYLLFLSDTLYWKNYMNEIVSRSKMESGGGGGGGGGGGSESGRSSALSGVVFFGGGAGENDIENLYDQQHLLLLSPAASHWVQPRQEFAYRNPPRGSTLKGATTDDRVFYNRYNRKSKKNRKRSDEDRIRARRALGGGMTVAADFNEEAVVRSFSFSLFFLSFSLFLFFSFSLSLFLSFSLSLCLSVSLSLCLSVSLSLTFCFIVVF